MSENKFLFEVSWEVCNKVGGIYTVIKTKLKEAIKHFDGNYILIGPLLNYNRRFIEKTPPMLEPIEKLLLENNIPCKLGYWDREGTPPVILVAYQHRYNIDELLYNFWSEFGVDSLASNFEYIEPILFSTAASEVIQLINENILGKETQVIAHFHEWLCGAGVLNIKRHTKEIVTVFTTHATVLGRALANSNINIYDLPIDFDPTEEARKYGVFSKHSLERAAAREADCFTTVSKITADEAYLMLNKYPDKIALNGLDVEKIHHYSLNYDVEKTRYKLRQVASQVIGAPIDEHAILLMTSGRYEFHNKGYDIFLKSLAKLKDRLGENSPPIIVFFLVAVNNHTENESLLKEHIELDDNQRTALGISTHKINNPKADPIISMCNVLGLREKEQKIHIIFSDAYLNGSDGVFDIPYEEIIGAFDLSVFPSYYEPWGYTPLESIAYASPTVTTDTAGFGDWVLGLEEDCRDVAHVLKYKNKNEHDVVDELCDYLELITKRDKETKDKIRTKTSIIAKLAGWRFFYDAYIDAYSQAIEFNNIYYAEVDQTEENFLTSVHELENVTPRFRLFQHECELPEQLIGLRQLAYNLWWSWNPEANILFKEIDDNLWKNSEW